MPKRAALAAFLSSSGLGRPNRAARIAFLSSTVAYIRINQKTTIIYINISYRQPQVSLLEEDQTWRLLVLIYLQLQKH
jgi:hypothetical protein